MDDVGNYIAAFGTAGVENAYVVLDSDHPPGACSSLLETVLRGGLVDQDSPRRLLVVTRPIEVRVGLGWARLEPNDGMTISIDKGPAVSLGTDQDARTILAHLAKSGPAASKGLVEAIAFLSLSGAQVVGKLTTEGCDNMALRRLIDTFVADPTRNFEEVRYLRW